jgi:hypothetical protein
MTDSEFYGHLLSQGWSIVPYRDKDYYGYIISKEGYNFRTINRYWSAANGVDEMLLMIEKMREDISNLSEQVYEKL